MTWQHTIPDPLIAYHAPKKYLPPTIGDTRTALQLWMPQGQHPIYTPAQAGHLTMITLHQWTPGNAGTTYEIHQTKNGVRASTQYPHRDLTLSEIETIAAIARREIQDYDKPKTTIGRFLEQVTGYRHRTKARSNENSTRS